MRYISEDDFKAFYRFYFLFNCEADLDAIILDEALVMLSLVFEANGEELTSIRAPHLKYFVTFLSSGNLTHLSFNDWMIFLEFQRISLDLSNYSDGVDWSPLIRDYVSWRRELQTLDDRVSQEISGR